MQIVGFPMRRLKCHIFIVIFLQPIQTDSTEKSISKGAGVIVNDIKSGPISVLFAEVYVLCPIQQFFCHIRNDTLHLQSKNCSTKVQNMTEVDFQCLTLFSVVIITKTCPCNIQRNFSVLKIENFIGKNLILTIFLLKTSIVGTH